MKGEGCVQSEDGIMNILLSYIVLNYETMAWLGWWGLEFYTGGEKGWKIIIIIYRRWIQAEVRQRIG